MRIGQFRADQGESRRGARENDYPVKSIAIEVLSFAVSLAIGMPALLHSDNAVEAVLVYLFVVCCGALGARLSAMTREAEQCAEFRRWAAEEVKKFSPA